MTISAFIPSTPALLGTFRTNVSSFAPCTYGRRPTFHTGTVAMCASSGSNGAKDGTADNEGDEDDVGGAFQLGRFTEFTSSPGNRGTQDDIVKEVLWQATRLTASESMDTMIQTHLDAVSDVVSDMYSRTERDIEERNARLAIQTSLPDISKWNKHLMDGTKASKQNRMVISQELAVVEALLRRATRKNRTRTPRRSRNTGVRNRRMSSINNTDSSSIEGESDVRNVNFTPSSILFTVIVCGVALESFETIASQEGSQRLANYAAFSALSFLMIAYLKSLHSALQKAKTDLDRLTGKGR